MGIGSGNCPRALDLVWIGGRVEFPLGAGGGRGGARNRGRGGQCWRQGGLEGANELPGKSVVGNSREEEDLPRDFEGAGRGSICCGKGQRKVVGKEEWGDEYRLFCCLEEAVGAMASGGKRTRGGATMNVTGLAPPYRAS